MIEYDLSKTIRNKNMVDISKATKLDNTKTNSGSGIQIAHVVLSGTRKST